MLNVVDLLLKRQVDSTDRRAKLLWVRIEEVADLSKGDTSVGKDLDPYKINNGLGTVAAITRVVPHWLLKKPDPVIVTDGSHSDPTVVGQLADRQELRHQIAIGESRLYNFTAHRDPTTAMPTHHAIATRPC